MLKFHERTAQRIFYRDLIILLMILVVGVIILVVSTRSYYPSSTSFCRAVGATTGSFTTKINVTKTSSYVAWARVESPLPIDFSYSPGQYNPLYLSVDTSSCFDLGENQNITLNEWTWINTLGVSTGTNNRIPLTKGVHSFTISGLYSSIDELILLNNNCIPNGTGSNCLPQKNNQVNIPN